MPSSFWSNEIKKEHFGLTWGDELWYNDDETDYHPVRRWIRHHLRRMGLSWDVDFVVRKDSDQPELILLFLDLIRDDDPGVRRLSAHVLGVYRPVDLELISALRKGMSDEDKWVSIASTRSLEHIADTNKTFQQTVEEILLDPTARPTKREK